MITLFQAKRQRASRTSIQPRRSGSQRAWWIGILAGSTLHAADLLKWDVTGSTGTTGSVAASAPAAGVSGGAMSATTSTGTGNSTSPSNTWNRAVIASPVPATATDALAAGNYFQFTTSAATGYTVSISGITGLSLSRTSNGPTSAALFYSTDGGTVFTQTGSDFTVGQTLASAGTAFGSSMASTPIVMAAGTTLQWRVVFWGGTGGRIGIGKAATDDVVLTGTSVADVAARNLAWTGSGSSDWNTNPSNLNWANPGAGNAAAAFATGDNAVFPAAASAVVDAAGVGAGTVEVTHSEGTVALSGGTLTALSLTKSGAGTLTVAGSHAFSGGTTLTGGTLQVEGNGALGSTAVTVGGGVLKTAAGVDVLANPITIASGGATIETLGDITFSGNALGTTSGLGFIKTGPGQLTLAGGLGAQNSAPVDFDLATGTVVFSGIGTTRQKNLVGISTLDGTLNLAGSTVMLHASTLTGIGSISVTHATSSLTSRLNVGRVDVNVPVDLVTNLNVESPNGINDLHLNAPIRGDAGLVKKGNGVVRLTAVNNHTTTAVDAGTLSVDTGGTLGRGDVTVASIATLRFTPSNAVTVSNAIGGDGAVRMSGTGAVALTGTNTYLGATTAADGTLEAPLLTDGGVPGSIGQAPSLAPFLVLGGGTLAHTGPTTSCDRAFTLGITGGGLAANGSGPLAMTATGPIQLTEPTATGVGALNVGTSYRIVAPGDTDFTLIGAADNNPDTVFVATGLGTGTGTVVYANSRSLRLSGTASGTSVLAADLGDAANASTNLVKNGTNTWSLTGTTTHSGFTRVNSGVLRLDGDHSGSRGPIQLQAGGLLGGNGTSGGAVTLMEAGGGLALRVSDWNGTPGTGHDDLAVAAFDGGSLPLAVTLDTTGLTGFSEGPKSFTVLTAAGGITGFNPYAVTVTAPGFTGSGYWSMKQSGNALVLEYSLTPPDPYLGWVGGFGLVDASRLGDPDRDSIPNALEFVLNGDPGKNDPAILPQVRREAGALVVSFKRRADSVGIAQTLRYGSDLVSWTNLAIPPTIGTHAVGAATVVVAAAASPTEQVVTVSLPHSAAVNGRLFASLSIVP